MALTPDNAARYVRFAQIGAIVAAALAVGAFIIPAGEPEIEEPTITTRNVAPGPRGGGEPERSIFDVAQVARQDWTTVVPALDWATPEVARQEDDDPNRLAQANGGETVEGEEGQPGQGEQPADGQVVQQAPPLIQGWRYLGPVVAGRQSSALMEIGGAQRFVFRGQTVGGFQLAEIESNRVIVEQRGVKYEITLSDQAFGGGEGGPTPARPETAAERLQRLRELRDRQQRQRDEAAERERNPRSGAQRS